ncbi:MAG TPA: putative glycoside hydrolase [Candidatus Paceibacterota bacterium]
MAALKFGIKAAIIIVFSAAAIYAIFLLSDIFISKNHEIVIPPKIETIPISSQTSTETVIIYSTTTAATTSPQASPRPRYISDMEPQMPLPNPPSIIKAVYATGWSAGNAKKMNYLKGLIRDTELNAIVIDIKDFSGYVLYDTQLEAVHRYGAVERRIPRINALIKELHDEGIYVIGRLAVFQDPRLAVARPDLALYSSTTKELWRDRLGLQWIDPASRESWDYNIAIAKEALSRGFDEINFDYIRFASDGNVGDIIYSFWDTKTPMRTVLREFFEYVRRELSEKKISADIFGLVTVNANDIGVGQVLEDVVPSFDAIAPMVYPSHYHSGFLGYKSPAQFPYEVVKYSLERAIARIENYAATSTAATSTMIQDSGFEIQAKLRPWLQDFDLGANYDAAMVKSQIQAVLDAASTTPELLGGWMLWNPENVYTKDALIPCTKSEPNNSPDPLISC